MLHSLSCTLEVASLTSTTNVLANPKWFLAWMHRLTELQTLPSPLKPVESNDPATPPAHLCTKAHVTSTGGGSA
eukprot:1159685-Pelagomonas_calceolata.AAC.5